MQVINCCKRQLLIDSVQRSILVYINAICANRRHYQSNYGFDTDIAFCTTKINEDFYGITIRLSIFRSESQRNLLRFIINKFFSFFP